jgi:hypothetical protein
MADTLMDGARDEVARCLPVDQSTDSSRVGESRRVAVPRFAAISREKGLLTRSDSLAASRQAVRVERDVNVASHDQGDRIAVASRVSVLSGRQFPSGQRR